MSAAAGDGALPGLEALFAPRGIALFGASADPGKVGGKPLHYLRRHGFPGRLVAVNPRHRELAGVPCLPALDARTAADGPLDLAVVAVGPEAVEPALLQAAAAGVRAAVVLTSGYAEVGEAGRARQARLAARARASGLRLLGPNCQGFVNVAGRVAASFTAALDAPSLRPGGVALVTQSGALGGVLLNRARERELGLALWVSTGNEADVTWLDCAEYALGQPATRVVAVYAEAIPDGRRLLALGRMAQARRVPLVVLAGGLSEAGRAAAESHTGALVGRGDVVRSLLGEAGIVRADTLDGLMDAAEVLAAAPVPAGGRVALLSTSGGAGVLAADALEGTEVMLASFGTATTRALREALPDFASARNPVDVTAQIVADPDLLRRALAACLADPGVDAGAVLLTMVTDPLARAVAAGIAEAAASRDKPVVVTWMAGALAREGYGVLRERGVPCFPTLPAGVAALAALARWAAALRRPARQTPARQRVELPAGTLIERAGRAFLARYGVRGPREIACATPAEARRAAEALGYPVVLKIEADGLPHKTEAGGVRPGLGDGAAVERAGEIMLDEVARRAPGARIRGLLVQEQVLGVAELLVGATWDASAGAVVTCGLGGVFVEALGDVAIRIAPVDEPEAARMLASLRAFPVLTGARGRLPADLAAAARAVAALSLAAWDLGPRLLALEINPLVVLADGQGALAVDALVATRPARPDPPAGA